MWSLATGRLNHFHISLEDHSSLLDKSSKDRIVGPLQNGRTSWGLLNYFITGMILQVYRSNPRTWNDRNSPDFRGFQRKENPWEWKEPFWGFPKNSATNTSWTPTLDGWNLAVWDWYLKTPSKRWLFRISELSTVFQKFQYRISQPLSFSKILTCPYCTCIHISTTDTSRSTFFHTASRIVTYSCSSTRYTHLRSEEAHKIPAAINRQIPVNALSVV